MLALAAHYDTNNDRFMIATGVANQDATMAVALWCAEDGKLLLRINVCTQQLTRRAVQVLRENSGGGCGHI